MKIPTYSFKAIDTCNMCHSNDFKFLGRRLNGSQGRNPKKKAGITISVMQCKGCGLIFSDPMPIPQELSDHYDVDPEEYWIPEYFEEDESYFKKEIEYALENIKTDNPKALDVGAGIGKAMKAMSRAGFDVYGIEPSKAFREACIEKMGIEPDRITLASIESASFPANHFDFISFGVVLEHVQDPSNSISKAMEWLKPNGLIHIEVPSARWLTSKLINTYYSMRGSRFVSNLSPMHTPYHLYEFSVEAFINNGKLNSYKVQNHKYKVTSTYLPKVLDGILKPIMKQTDTGLQLEVWLQK
ncbi:MAG: class I SAM-dependent methyltransferase [Bacteroidota bacterium]